MAQVVQYNYVVHRILSSGKAVFDVVLKQLTEFSTIILMVLLFFLVGWFWSVQSQAKKFTEIQNCSVILWKLYNSFNIYIEKNSLLHFSRGVKL